MYKLYYMYIQIHVYKPFLRWRCRCRRRVSIYWMSEYETIECDIEQVNTRVYCMCVCDRDRKWSMLTGSLYTCACTSNSIELTIKHVACYGTCLKNVYSLKCIVYMYTYIGLGSFRNVLCVVCATLYVAAAAAKLIHIIACNNLYILYI